MDETFRIFYTDLDGTEKTSGPYCGLHELNVALTLLYQTGVTTAYPVREFDDRSGDDVVTTDYWDLQDRCIR
jgi:hypothetical protein